MLIPVDQDVSCAGEVYCIAFGSIRPFPPGWPRADCGVRPIQWPPDPLACFIIDEPEFLRVFYLTDEEQIPVRAEAARSGTLKHTSTTS